MFASFRAAVAASAARALKSAIVLSLGLMAGACSHKAPAGPQVFSWMLDDPAPQNPDAHRVEPARVELEDDGLPAQAPPTVRIRQAEDDPSQPWSRNYGGPAAQPVPLEENGTPPSLRAGGNAIAAGAGPDDGYPDPQTPEEAGVRLPPPKPIRGASLSLPGARCTKSGTGWLCTR